MAAQRLDLGAVDALTGDPQYPRDVAQMPITTPFGEIPEFAEDHVFGGGNHQIAVREKSDRSPPAHLSAAPMVVARQDEVDLVARTWMNHVELEGSPYRVSDRRFTQVKLVLGKGSHQLVDVLHFKRGNDVDVLREARLAVGDAGNRPNNDVRDFHALERFNRVTQDIELLHHPTFSAGIRGVALRRSNPGKVAGLDSPP